MKVIIYLTPTSLTSHGPRLDHPGASGTPYPYEWSTQHQRHILHGRPLDAEEFAKLAPDVFAAEKSYRVPLPLMVEDNERAPTAEAPPVVTVDSLFEQSRELSVAERRKLGGRLLNATRGPRKNKANRP